jgi:hypothetical protein
MEDGEREAAMDGDAFGVLSPNGSKKGQKVKKTTERGSFGKGTVTMTTSCKTF